MNRTLVVVNVHGGLVQEVFCADSQAQIVVVDWDNQGQDPDGIGVVAVPSDSGRTQLAVVVEHTPEPLATLAGTEVAKALAATGVEYDASRAPWPN